MDIPAIARCVCGMIACKGSLSDKTACKQLMQQLLHTAELAQNYGVSLDQAWSTRLQGEMHS